MGYIMDIVLLAIFTTAIILGVRRGFVKSAMRFIGSILAAVISSFLGGVLATVIYDALFRDALVKRIASISAGFTGEEMVRRFVSSLPDFLVRSLGDAGITTDSILVELAKKNQDTAVAIADILSPIFISFLKVLLVIICFMLLMLLVKILTNVLSSAIDFSFLSGINGLLGGVFGLLLILVIVWVIISSVNVFLPMLSEDIQKLIEEFLETSIFSKWIVGFNPFNLMFK